MVDLTGVVKGDASNYNENELYFDTTSVKKVVWLSLLTFGVYEIIWFYKTWKTLAVRFGYKVSPFWRAIFGTITGFWLFPIIADYVKKFNVESFNGIVFAILYLIITLLYRLPNQLWLICMASVVIIAIVQDKINKVNAQHFPNAQVNKWSGINTFWAILGGIITFFAVIGSFIPE